LPFRAPIVGPVAGLAPAKTSAGREYRKVSNQALPERRMVTRSGGALQYMLLIYDDEGEEAALPEEDLSAIVAAHGALARKWREEGRLLAGDRLQPSDTATTVRMVDGKIVMTDGPYADTKEQLGGFYIIEAEDLDQALADASVIPSVGRSIIEVRPVWT
jgi:hypothetical protein